jgi:hypothetical protein
MCPLARRALAFLVTVAACGPGPRATSPDGGRSADGSSSAGDASTTSGPPAFAWTGVAVTDSPGTGWSTSPSDVYVCGLRTIEHSADSGQTWSTAMSYPAPQGLMYSWGSGPTDQYLVGFTPTQPGPAVAFRWDGSALQQLPLGSGTTSAEVVGVWGRAPGDVYAIVGSRFGTGSATSSIQHSVDYGQTWTVLATPNTDISPIWGWGDDELYVAQEIGEQATVLHSADAGMTWITQPVVDDGTIASIWGSGPDDVYAVTTTAGVLHSGDHGASWQLVLPAQGGMEFQDLTGTGPNDVNVLGWQGGGDNAGNSYYVLHSTDRGATWSETSNLMPDNNELVDHIWMAGPDDAYIAAQFSVMHGHRDTAITTP